MVSSQKKATNDFTGISEKQVLEFRLQCKTFLTERLKKVLTKSTFFTFSSKKSECIESREMAAHTKLCVEMHVQKVVFKLVAFKRVK